MPDEAGGGDLVGGRFSGPGGATALPCLNNNNSTELLLCGPNASNYRKTAFCLEFNIRALAQRFTLEKLGFLTLTFPEDVTKQECSKKFNSLATHVLRSLFAEYICVVERGCKGGRLHLHLVVVCKEDIRTGFDFEAIGKGDYSSANRYLRHLWATLRTKLPRYGFGRHELLPVRSTEEGISKYVGKYIAKHIDQRNEEDKGLRLVRYSKGASQARTRFMWATKGSRKWREHVAFIASECGFKSTDDFYAEFGRHWSHALREAVKGEIVTVDGQQIELTPEIQHPRKVDDPWRDVLPAKPLPRTRRRQQRVFDMFQTLSESIVERAERRRREALERRFQTRNAPRTWAQYAPD